MLSGGGEGLGDVHHVPGAPPAPSGPGSPQEGLRYPRDAEEEGQR